MSSRIEGPKDHITQRSSQTLSEGQLAWVAVRNALSAVAFSKPGDGGKFISSKYSKWPTQLSLRRVLTRLGCILKSKICMQMTFQALQGHHCFCSSSAAASASGFETAEEVSGRALVSRWGLFADRRGSDFSKCSDHLNELPSRILTWPMHKYFCLLVASCFYFLVVSPIASDGFHQPPKLCPPRA